VRDSLKGLVELDAQQASIASWLIEQSPHLLFFSVLGALAGNAGGRKLLGAALGIAVVAELVQALTATRSPEWTDLMVNVVSVLGAWWISSRVSQAKAPPLPAEPAGDASTSR
jgi:hypothetical protein